ncbi:hypothetical protein PVAND_004044 [Polypedilum vanderplanki]|uniref:N-acetylgalactosaminide beta-1,3-galactosyltransferase n=1 Tax=Polypedilum vanderplanki TaxID=319348 RepID=A0A9J6BVX9_POLVA|nr:hypothetical protein PVAND_004044 [Polypedilum vanderplanki]
MNVSKLNEFFLFFVGLNFGIYLYFTFLPVHKRFLKSKQIKISNNEVTFETTLADQLIESVRIFCYILTHPENHKIKIPHMKSTWAKRCDKLIIFSTEFDINDPDIVALSNLNGRDHLWNKTKYAMKYLYDHHINDADWFVRADDDNYFLIENLRHKLFQYDSRKSIFIGNRYAFPDDRLNEGYMAGGGHVFSKKALTKFVTKLMPNGINCMVEDATYEDVNLGMCFKTHAAFVDALDSKNQKQMFPVGIQIHANKTKDVNYWYWNYTYTEVAQGSLDCCSDLFISKHYVEPEEQHLLEYLVYHVHPFGILKNFTEKIPEKVKMEEVLKKSDIISNSPQFVPHEIEHNFDEDEKI